MVDVERKNGVDNSQGSELQKNLAHIQDEINQLSNVDKDDDEVKGIEWMLTDEFGDYLKQNNDILQNLNTAVSNYLQRGNSDPNLKLLGDYLSGLVNPSEGQKDAKADQNEQDNGDKEFQKQSFEKFKWMIVGKNEKDGTNTLNLLNSLS